MIHDKNPNELIEKIAVELRKVISMPSWAKFVKTGAHKERPPVDDEWWYMRVASILRKIYLKGPIGVSKLRIAYGGKRNRGYKPEKFYRGSGKIIRAILQQLEKAELIKQGAKGVHKGRILTPKGIKFINQIAK